MKRVSFDNPLQVQEDAAFEVQFAQCAADAQRFTAISLLAQGQSCRQVATTLGVAVRTVQYWAQRYRAGNLLDSSMGRPPRLTPDQFDDLRKKIIEGNIPHPKPWYLRGRQRWSGPALQQVLREQYGVKISPRQAQRVLAELARSLISFPTRWDLGEKR